MSLKIVNVIASTRIRGSIDIEALSQKLHSSQYNPEIFPGLVYRQNKKPTIIMFASGKISSHGAKSESEAKQAIEEALSEIRKLGALLDYDGMDSIKIENVVGTMYLNHNIDFDELLRKYPMAIYEPEQFPGLMIRPFRNSLVGLLFTNGKVVIVGAKSEEQIKNGINEIIRIIQE